MYSFFKWNYFVYLTMALVRSVPATLGDRQRRFLTPTTYPVPTIPVNNPIAGSVLSVPVRCPLKREVGDHLRVNLDQDLMREIYLREVGKLDRKYLAETLIDAMNNFHGVKHELSSNKDSGPGSVLFHNIKAWLRARKNSTATPLFNEVESIHRPFDQLQNHNSFLRPGRIKRNADGSVSRVEYCTARGKKTPDGYLHMCASCAMTTILPDDKFPRYINEVSCDSSDCKCFDVRGTSHGKCKVRIHHVKMLRKLPKGCRMTIYNGQQVITDTWEIYDYPLRVGCECVINKQSMFATFIPKPVG